MGDTRKATILKVDGNYLKMQTVQITGLDGEMASNVERYQPYGLTTFLVPADADGRGPEGILSDLGSTSLRTVTQVDDRRFRTVHGSVGDVILYSKHDNPTATHDNALQRFAFTDDGTGNYRAVLKINTCKIDVKSDHSILIDNGQGVFVDIHGAYVEINNGSSVVKLEGSVATISASTVNVNATSTTISGSSIALSAPNVSLG
jgi:phage gp45-like